MMKGNINLISYDCYQQATEKQLARTEMEGKQGVLCIRDS